MLATDPSHQNQGAATILLSSLIAEADTLGIDIYCEATKSGRPLYEKFGFVALEMLHFDPKEFGVEDLGIEIQTAMLRKPLSR